MWPMGMQFACTLLNNKIVFNSVFSVVGKCPVYNYAFGSTTATGRTCTHFKKGCPDPKYSPYHSSSFYKCMFTSQFDKIDWYHFSCRSKDYSQIIRTCLIVIYPFVDIHLFMLTFYDFSFFPINVVSFFNLNYNDITLY